MQLLEYSPSGQVTQKWRLLDEEGFTAYLEQDGFNSVPTVMKSERLRFSKPGCHISVYPNGTVYVTGSRRSHGNALCRRVDGIERG